MLPSGKILKLIETTTPFQLKSFVDLFRAAILLAALFIFTSATYATPTTVYPTESNEILYNPGMGFANFHDSWGGPTPSFSAYPTARVAYFRWSWYELEPTEGQYNFAMVDNVINQMRAKNQTLAFRIMPAIPDWLKNKGVQQLGTPGDELPDHNNPLFLYYHEKIVKAFGARYAGSLDVDHVDIGSVGCWGEWNSACCPPGSEATCESFMPTQANRRSIIDWYFTTFSNTPLVALAEDPGYATSKGAGWRGDCFGDYGFWGSWSHMGSLYPLIVQDPAVTNAWHKAPVQFEACYVMQAWYDRGFDIDLILQKGLDWHMSVFNGKNSAVPAAWRPKVDEWLKKIGYRFVLNQLSHESQVSAGNNLIIGSVWTNKGVAPVYHKWPVAYRLRAANDAVVAQWQSPLDLRTWLPGSHTLEDTVQIPSNLAPGAYSLDVAILNKTGDQAFVQLAITEKRPDNWYPVSSVQIVENAQDSIAPSVSVSAPSNNNVVFGVNVQVSAAASDNVEVVGVQFKINGQALGAEDVAAPFNVNWNTTAYANGSYTITATARDAAGNATTSSPVAVTVSNQVTSPGDTIAPTVPTGLAVTSVGRSSLSFRWNSSTDNVGVAGYQILRNGVAAATTSATNYTDTGLARGRRYSYQVRAYDAKGNMSAASATLNITTSKK
jgi:chitodextrinase